MCEEDGAGMVQQLIVPTDGSLASWKAFDVALELAERLDVGVNLLEVATDPVDGRFAAQRLHDELADRGPFGVEVDIEVRLQVETVADELARAIETRPGVVLVMASHGRGRSAAILGSVAEATVRRTNGPIVLVGPSFESAHGFGGPLLATVDGSDESEVALPVATAWASALRVTPWIVHATPPLDEMRRAGLDADDVLETGHLARLASHFASLTGSRVEFEQLHGRQAVRAVSEHARRCGASLVVASSHGRSGLSRLALGSVAAGFVHSSPCPVLVVRQAASAMSTGPIRRSARPTRR